MQRSTKAAPTTAVKPVRAVAAPSGKIACSKLSLKQLATMNTTLQEVLATSGADQEQMREAMNLQLVRLRDREDRLTDAFLERAIDRGALDERRATLNNERIGLEQALIGLGNPIEMAARGAMFLELLKTLKNLAQLENPNEIREVCRNSVSNFTAHGKTVDITWQFPASLLFCGPIVHSGAQSRDESIGSGSVRDGDTSIWAEEKIREVLTHRGDTW